jgi:co-chaperonin GroES (HSP10)
MEIPNISGLCVWRRGEAIVRAAILLFMLTCPLLASAQMGTQTAAVPKAPASVGTIETISGNTLAVTADGGAQTKVLVPPEAKLLRVPPGSKDLKEAVPIQLSDLQVGDRILVRGKPGADPTSYVATSVIAMKKGDIAEKQSHEREEWQRHGIGGLVRGMDANAGVITIGAMTQTGNKEVAIHVGSTTIFRRYASDSVKFDDARLSVLSDIKAGDQLRARGMRSADGSEFTAEEIVTGSFRNIAGTIIAVNANAAILTVADLVTNKPVEVKVNEDSQVRKLPPPMAQRIAMRLKGAPPDANVPAGAPPGSGGQTPGGGPAGGMRGQWGNGGGGGGDLQQMLSRLPASPLSEFQKGDAVMIVATSGQKDAQATAITLLGGVEPILQASPQGQAASILTPWSLSSGGDNGTP